MKSNAENMETTLYDTPNNTGCKHTQQLSASVLIETDTVAVITITVPIKTPQKKVADATMNIC